MIRFPLDIALGVTALSVGRATLRFAPVALCCCGFRVLVSDPALAQLEFEAEPINYNTAPVTDRVSQLQQRLDRDEVILKHDDAHGYLPAVLEALDVPISSQMLVFSKTSFQLRRITPRRPRAVYFNDDVYVGWVQGGDVVEIASADPQLGAVFYTLDQKPSETPKFVRDRGQCITCHASSRTAGVPGHLVRSVYADRAGQPFFGSGTFTTDHRSPFKQRWGGWYVSGTHGRQRHMGNVVVHDRDRPEQIDVEDGANITELKERLNVAPYLAPHSDIEALMVLEHQTRMHNLITRANFETRSALYYDDIMNRALDRPSDYRSDSARRRIESAVDKMVEYMLFADEFQLTDAVSGTSTFAAEFSAQGPRDSKGRSLRDLDMSVRLMKYPCSYLIYSAPFDELPKPAKEHACRRLFEILTSAGESDAFAHLTTNDRQAILEILRETKPDLPDYWTGGG